MNNKRVVLNEVSTSTTVGAFMYCEPGKKDPILCVLARSIENAKMPT